MSLTTTLFLGFACEKHTALYFDPEIAGGRDSAASMALPTHRTANCRASPSATPKPYLARLYVSHDFGFGDETESVESDENQLAGERP